MAKRVTVYDIAEAVGLSASTVSRVLNNSILISDEKRDLILKAAAEMGYARRTIRRHRNRAIVTLALFLPRLQERHLHLFYEITGLISTIRSSFGETRVNVITDIVSTASEHLESKKVGGIDGAVFAFCEPDTAVRKLLTEREIPFCLVNRNDPDCNYVDCDHTAGTGRLVRELLVVRPHAEPCYIDFRPIATISDRRREGFLSACREAGLAAVEERVFGITSFSEISGAALRRLTKRYDALVAFNDVLAVYIYQQALNTGIAIPRRAALTGFDGSPAAGLITPQLTTMSMPLDAMVAEAAGWLYRRIMERSTEPLQLTIPAEYVAGETIRA